MGIANDKKIIIAFIALFLISSVYISLSVTKQADPDFGKDWWELSFIEPKSADLSFSIGNHGERENFHWQILDGKNVLNEGRLTVPKGGQESITIPTENIADKKITVLVSDGKYKKEIYKSFVEREIFDLAH